MLNSQHKTELIHDGSSPGDTRERCCICRRHTPYWHQSDVALCQPCALVTAPNDLPCKAEWCTKEHSLTPGH